MYKKYLFLDRDGVINEDIGYLHRTQDLIFKEGIFELIKEAFSKNYKIHIVTNQSGIARGFFSEEELYVLMNTIIKILQFNLSTKISWSYCPFLENASDKKYQLDSYNRKPNPGMIIYECNNMQVLKSSIMVGDKKSDFISASRAGVGNFIHLSDKSISSKLNFPYLTKYIFKKSLREIVEIL